MRHKVFKSCMKIPNNFSALSPSGPVPEISGRGVRHNRISKHNHLHDNLFLPAPIFGDPSEKQSQTKKHCAKKNVLRCFKLWDCHIKQIESANHLIHCRLIRNDSSWRRIFLTNSVLTILFFSFPKALPLGQGMLPLRGDDPARIMNRIINHDLFCIFQAHFEARSPSRHNQQAEGLTCPSPMATPWETMNQNQMATTWENKQNCGLRHKVFKSCMKIPNNFSALSPSGPVPEISGRVVRHNLNLKDNHLHDNLFLPAVIFGDPSEKQSQTKKHCAKKMFYGASNYGIATSNKLNLLTS